MPCNPWRTWLGLGATLICLGACAASSPDVQDTAQNDSSQDSSAAPAQRASSATTPLGSHAVSGITLTYQNDASTLRMNIDPYEENLNIEMKHSPRKNEPEKEKAPEIQHDTVYLPQAANPQPQPTPVQTQAAPASLQTVQDSAPPVDTAAILEKSSQKANEALRLIQQAQEYFYRQDYANALRLVKAAQETWPTAEASALRGSIHYMLADKDAARLYWNEALSMNPDMPQVSEALRRLDQPREDH